MRRSRAVWIALTLILVNVEPIVEPAAAVEPPRNRTGSNLIVQAKGDVLLKRKNWQKFQRTAVGTTLDRADLLRVAKGAKAVVLCADLTRWTVPDGMTSGVSNGCPPPRQAVYYNGNPIDPPRSDRHELLANSIPYIISPRRTLLLNNKPTLRWNAVPGATSYTVRLKGSGGDIWQSSVNGTSVVYPGEPPLEAGVYYSLIVEADNGASSLDERASEEGFWLLDAQGTGRLQADIQKLTEQQLPEDAAGLALAHTYVRYGLFAEAIEKLSALVGGGFGTSSAYLMLGDRYWQVGLTPLALQNYLQAIELSKAAQDVEGQAAASVALGNVYATIENYEEATRWLTVGQGGYQALGDEQRVSELTQLLEKLKKYRKN